MESLPDGNYYVYALMDPITKLPFYIGKGKGNRAWHHLNGRDKNNKKKVRMIELIRLMELEPEVQIPIQNVDEDTAYFAERIFIQECRKRSIPITNICLDNRPPSRLGWVMPLDVKNKIRLAHTGKAKPPLSDEHKEKISKGNTGKVLSDSAKLKVSMARKGKSLSDEHRKKLSEAHRGKTPSIETRLKMSVSHRNRSGKSTNTK